MGDNGTLARRARIIVEKVATMTVYPVGVKQIIRANPLYLCHPRAIKNFHFLLDFLYFFIISLIKI